MGSENKEFNEIYKLKITHLIHKINDINKIIEVIEKDNSPLSEFLINQYNFQKAEFLKDFCYLLISSGLPSSEYIDYLLDTINLIDKYNPETQKSLKISKPLDNEFNKIHNILKFDLKKLN